MHKLIQESQNPKLKDYKLPKSWSCDPQTVIHLNFSGINLNAIDMDVKKQILKCLYTTKEEIEIQINKYKEFSASQLLSDVCDDFPRIVILIDEYDTLLNDNLYNETTFNHIAQNFYKPFFSIIKLQGQRRKINQCVVTGILRFSHVGIFSGFLFIFYFFLKINIKGQTNSWI